MIELMHGDCLEQLKHLPDNSVDSVVTDPPYGLSFMGKKWDYDVPSEDVWRECLRVLKPGGHLLAFAGTRTQHRMAVRIEDAGFEIRDMIAWVYGSGFPKSHNIGKAVDKLQGNERVVVGHDQSGAIRNAMAGDFAGGVYDLTKGTSPHEGWGTALKPALEPITVARKPLTSTVASNVLEWGTGGINVDGCRVPAPDNYGVTWTRGGNGSNARSGSKSAQEDPQLNGETVQVEPNALGRFPANLIHDGSEVVVGLFPNENARFFYCAKASKKDRDEGLTTEEQPIVTFATANGTSGKPSSISEGRNTSYRNNHPTVKPTDLMRYLCRLVTPPNGIVLDPFMGSGSTGKAAIREGFRFIGIEREADYIEIAKARIGV